MDILMLGSGGREHALIKKLKESPKAGKFIVPQVMAVFRRTLSVLISALWIKRV